MNLLKIIFSGIILFFLFIFVFVLSYFPYSKPNITQINTKGNEYIGLSKIVKNKGNYDLEKTEKFQKDSIYKDNVDKIDEFYFLPKSQDSYKKSVNLNNIKIDVKDGLYFANIVDLTYNYKINNSNFTLTPKSPGRFYFDTRDSSKIKIFSFDSIVEISLLDAEKKQVSTTMVLYPHMNFTFNSTRNKLVKNADLLRLESVFDISYIKESFSNLEVKEFIDTIYKGNDIEVLSFFLTIRGIVYNKDNFSKYDNIDKLLIQNNYTLPGFQYITKYFVLFLNDSKKSVYYKNIILEKLNNLSRAEKDYEVNNYKNELKETLDKLREINEDDYKEMYELVAYYYTNLLRVNDVKYINNAFALSKLLMELDGTSFTNKNTNSAFLVSKLYSIIDNTDFEKVELQENLITYLNSFFKENNITIDEKNNSLVIKNGRKVVKDLDSLSFFIKNVLLYNTSFSDNDDISNTISLFKTYFYINNSLTILVQNKYESFLIEYSSILDKVLTEMRKSFFEEKLDGDNLLVLSDKNLISKSNLSKLNTTIKLFFDFNTKNKSYLSEKNMIYEKFYERNGEEYKEYYLALTNYDEYSILYNKTKNELLSTKTVLENKEDIVLSVENFKKYITQFLGVDLSSSTVKIVNDEYYKVDKVSINGANFSFDLYPKSQNLLNNIYKNGSALNLSYELDSLEYDLKDLYEGADDEQKDKYDFKRFFLNTFFGNNLPTQTTQQFVYESNAPLEEDRAISLFKRDKLVGSKGDFSILRGFLDVGYNDVLVKLNGKDYDITLSGSKLTADIESDDVIYGIFSSKYIFSDKDHYFSNIKILLYTEGDNGNKNYLFGGVPVIISKKINTVDFKKEITSILEKKLGISK